MTTESSKKNLCIITKQPDTESKSNPNLTTKQHAVVCIGLNIVTRPTYAEKFMRDDVVAPIVSTFCCHCHTAHSIPHQHKYMRCSDVKELMP